MRCRRCQQENPAQARFCMKCGASMTFACAKCGTELPAAAAFCFSCGQSVAGTSSSPAAAAAPSAYTPKHLAERIIDSKAALEGERKQVTVLFADLKGSMELLADRDPEEARKILDPVLERMMEAVHRYEGTVNQVMGDGIMALFGAPLAHEDHAVRACYAALRMQETVKQYAKQARRAHAAVVKIRVGLNSGEVVVRSIGSDLRMDYTAVGQTTHLAARMEQIADPGAIVLAPDTLALAEAYIDVKSLGEVAVKGLAEPIEVYEVVGASAFRSRLQAAAVRGLTRFVGRDAETDHLQQALELSKAGRGQAVAVVGEPGVGKSRLYYEFIHSQRVRDCLVIESGSVSYGKATAYLPIIDLLKAYFRIDPRDTERTKREKIAGKLLTLDRSLESLLPPFSSLIDVPVEDAAWERSDPPQRHQRIVDGMKRLLIREAQAQPLVVVFEDLHWIDGETQRVLDAFMDSLPSARVLLLVNYRPEYTHGWASKTFYRQLRIDPLPAASAAELLDSLLGGDSSVQSLKPALIERTEGTPFFLEESVRTLFETGVLAGEIGACRLMKPFRALDVPSTVKTILAARIDRLDAADKRVLQSASVIGKDFALTLLQALVDELPEDDLRASLGRLQTSEFVYEKTLFPELEYTFKHALTHEVAYGALLQERKRALHSKALEALETTSVKQAVDVDRLAHHAYRGEEWGKSVGYLTEAGRRAAARSAHREAVAYFDQALDALGHLSADHQTLVTRFNLRLQMRQSFFPLGDHERTHECLKDAASIAATLRDDDLRVKAASYEPHYYWTTGRHEASIEAGRAALAADKSADPGVFVRVHLFMTQALLALGRHRESVAAAQRALAKLEEIAATREALGMAGPVGVFARTWLGWSLAECGDFPAALDVAEENLRIVESMDHLYARFHAYFGVGIVHERRRDLAGAVDYLERANATAAQGNLPVMLQFSSVFLASAYALTGRHKEAVRLIHRTETESRRMGLALVHSMSIGVGAEALRLSGALDDAREWAERALQISRASGERGQEAWRLRTRAELQAQTGGDPLKDYESALAIASELDMRALVAHCHQGIGTFYRQDDHLATAARLYDEMEVAEFMTRVDGAAN